MQLSGLKRVGLALIGAFLAVVLISSASAEITFRDITAQSGIHFSHNNGAFGKKYRDASRGLGKGSMRLSQVPPQRAARMQASTNRCTE